MWSYNYSYSQPTTELYHHGVKGMKWGVRKQREKKDRKAKKYSKKINQIKQKINKESNKNFAKDYKKIAERNADKVDSLIAKYEDLVDDIYFSGYELRELSSGEYYVVKRIKL